MIIERLKQLEAEVHEREGCWDFEEAMQEYEREVVAVLPKLLAVVEAAQGIKQREDIGGYGHEGIPDLLEALAVLEKEDV